MKRKIVQGGLFILIVLVLVFSGYVYRSKFASEADIGILDNPNYEVIVVGGGTGGVAAGIQSARLGAKTLIIEETDWLGGMYTTAGISAFDGPLNQNMSSGIFLEIEKKIHQYYCPNRPYPCSELAQGSVSRTGFEPHVVKKILEEMVSSEKNLTVKYKLSVTEVIKDRKTNTVTGIEAKNSEGNKKKYFSKVLLDATEYGDMVKLAGAAYNLGRECYGETQEPHALGGPQSKEPCYPSEDPKRKFIQAITYSIPIKRYDTPQAMNEPPNYDANKYEIPWVYYDKYNPAGKFIYAWEPTTTTWKNGFIQYGWNPDSSKENPTSGNNAFFLNFPLFGNDLAEKNYIEATTSERQTIFQEAKNHSLGYLYFLKKNVPEAANWGIDTEEFNTTDNLPLIPYVREGRRLRAVETLTEKDLSKELNPSRGVFKASTIALGDYPMDLHSSLNDPNKNNGDNLNPSALGISTSPFQIPYGALVPEEVDGLLVADKSIGVTHIANGATRLQPVVTAIGQAAGAAAALASRYNIQPRNLNVDLLQDVLLSNKSMLFYLNDVASNRTSFKEIQTIALKKITQGYPDLTFKPNELTQRSIWAIFLVRALGLQINTNGGPHFSDVPVNSTGYAEIETLYNNNLIAPFNNGCPIGKFCPSYLASRATTVASVVNSYHIPLINPTEPSFTDVPPSYWAYKEIETALGKGLIKKEGNFNPNAASSREFIAEILYRATQRLDFGKYEMSFKDSGTGKAKETHIIVWKTGIASQNLVKITASIPENSSYVSSNPEGLFDGKNITWDLGTQGANAEGFVTYMVNY